MSLLLTLFLGFHPLPAQTENHSMTDVDRLMAARTIRCEFHSGTHATFSKSLEAKIETTGKFGESFLFKDIKLREGVARLTGSASTTVRARLTTTGLTFLEETESGNLVFYTVFFSPPNKKTRNFASVMSRHMDLIGDLVPSQYYGECEVTDTWRK